MIRLGGESEEAVKYKIDLTYSETSRKFRQQIAIVGIRGMTFEEFLKSLKNLANFAHSSEFTLYVEKEQGKRRIYNRSGAAVINGPISKKENKLFKDKVKCRVEPTVR